MNRDQLIKAKKLISKPRKWCQGPYSIDCFGMKCLAGDSNAVQWCALSACNKYAKDIYRTELKLAAMQLGFFSIIHLNDTGTHADVMAMFDMAIRLTHDKANRYI